MYYEILALTIVTVGLMVPLALFGIVLNSQKTLAKAIEEGRRRGFSEAAEHCEARGDSAIRLSSRGNMLYGLSRCSAYLDIAKDLRDMVKTS